MKPYLMDLDVASRVQKRQAASIAPIDEPVSNALRPAEHLGDLALMLRDEFKLGGVTPEADILASLQRIVGETDAPERWLALFNSPLGRGLRARGRDLNTAMGFVLSRPTLAAVRRLG